MWSRGACALGGGGGGGVGSTLTALEVASRVNECDRVTGVRPASRRRPLTANLTLCTLPHQLHLKQNATTDVLLRHAHQRRSDY